MASLENAPLPLDYASIKPGVSRIAPALSCALAAAIPLGLLSLQVSIRPNWPWVLGLTTAGGLAAATMAAIGIMQSRIRIDFARNMVAMLIGLGIVAMGPVIVQLDTPFYRQHAVNIKCLSGLTESTKKALMTAQAAKTNGEAEINGYRKK